MERDDKLARALARQFLSTVDAALMAEYLLEEEVAVALLAARFRKNPEQTIQDLQAMQGAGAPVRRRAKGKGAPAVRPVVGKKRGAKRYRLNAAKVAELKAQVRAHLAKQRWATRKELTAVVDLPTQAIYRRIMTELQEAGDIISKGEKAKRVYALKGARVDGGRGKKTKKAKKTKKKAARKAKTKRVRKGGPKAKKAR